VIGFLNPLALLGLLAAGIPPLLHLLGRRQPPTVVFPAIRYLTAAEREHSRRLKLRNLVLLLLRMAVVVCVVLALSRPVVRVRAGASHPPAAVALVLDNSLSSGAVVQGRSVLDVLRARARSAIEHLGADDRFWLLTADGVPRRADRASALAALDSMRPLPLRLDLDDAVRVAATLVLAADVAIREVVVLSDLQASAFSGGPEVEVPVLVLDPPPAPENLGVDSVAVEPRSWAPSGSFVLSVGGQSARRTAARAYVDGADVARTVVAAGDRVSLAGTARRRGWLVGEVRLDPDELRADDRRWVAIRATDPVPVRADDGAGRFVQAGIAVLQDAGKVGHGEQVVFADGLRGLRTVLVPPSDPALVGAVNRGLEARGSTWRLGTLLDGEWVIEGELDGARGATVRRRYRLNGSGIVVATAGGEPWLVRDGDVTIVASRLAEDWTALPTSAGFLPFLEAIVNRVAVRVTGIAVALPGEVVAAPPEAVALATPQGVLPIAGDHRLVAPLAPGVYFALAAGGDTVGAVEVNADPRETLLAPASAGQVRASWGATARVLDAAVLDRELFGGARRMTLASALLVAALVAAIAELLVSTSGASRKPT
jgi:hypothetical protein